MKFIINPIRERFRRAHPDHYLIAKGMAWVILFVFFGKIAGAVKEMAVAARYGISGTVDAYLFIFNLVTWPVGIWFGILTVVLIPLVARIRKDSPAELSRFRAELLGLTLLIGAVLALLFWIGLPILMNSRYTGLPSSTVTIAIHMVPRLALLALLGVLVSLFSAWTLSAGRHVNTLLEGVPALTILIALLVFYNGGAEPLIWGTLVGFIFHVLCLVVSLAWRGEIEKPRFALQSPQWSVFWQGFGVMLVGQILISFTGIIDQFFAGHLGAGAIASIGYANRILSLILSLGALAVSRATLPIFSRTQAEGGQSHRVAIHWVRILFILGLIAMVISWWLAPSILKFIFERGAFTATDTKAVTEIFRYGLVQLPFYFAALVLVSFLASRQKYMFIAIASGGNLLVKLAANFALIPFMGVKGILAATAVMHMGSFAMFYFFFQNFLKDRSYIK